MQNINISITQGDKAALVGNNGTGKSTLLKILSGKLPPASGNVSTEMPLFISPSTLGSTIAIRLPKRLR